MYIRSTVWKNAKKGAPLHILGFCSIYQHYKLRNHSYWHSGPWEKYQFFDFSAKNGQKLRKMAQNGTKNDF